MHRFLLAGGEDAQWTSGEKVGGGYGQGREVNGWWGYGLGLDEVEGQGGGRCSVYLLTGVRRSSSVHVGHRHPGRRPPYLDGTYRMCPGCRLIAVTR